MEEQNFNNNQIINNQVFQKEKNYSEWTFLIPLIQIFGCGFLFLMSLGLCGWPGDGRGSDCALGQRIEHIDIIIFFGLPILVLIFSFLKKKTNHKKIIYPLVNFLISGIIPLLVLGYLFFQNYSYKKEIETSAKIIQDRINSSSKIENYSITTKPATEITNHGAVLNAEVGEFVNGIPPNGNLVFYIGTSKTNMDSISGVRCEEYGATYTHCDQDLNVRQGEPILPLKPNTTYYFTVAIEFYPMGGEIKKDDNILSFTTL